MTVATQIRSLLDAGVAEAAGIAPAALVGHARLLGDEPDTVVAVHPDLVPAERLALLLRYQGLPGFVVEDMVDLGDFVPVTGLVVPDQPLYLLHAVERGDDLRNWSPDEAVPELSRRGRTPLTITEGISWLLQEPKALEPNHCFMTAGSRKRRGSGLDARTPAIWISGGTGRDGRERRGAPKVGWCWAGNRHTWLGFASTTGRTAPTLPG